MHPGDTFNGVWDILFVQLGKGSLECVAQLAVVLTDVGIVLILAGVEVDATGSGGIADPFLVVPAVVEGLAAGCVFDEVDGSVRTSLLKCMSKSNFRSEFVFAVARFGCSYDEFLEIFSVPEEEMMLFFPPTFSSAVCMVSPIPKSSDINTCPFFMYPII